MNGNFENIHTVYCEVLENQSGEYGTIVVYDKNKNCYQMMTLFPNWQGVIPKKGDVGYLEYELCEAGVTKWYDSVIGQHVPYKYSYVVFKQFVRETPKFTEEAQL